MRAPDGPIHGYFGLTYSNYLVAPRTVLQSMPLDWQERFVALLNEIDEVFPDLPSPTYDVRVLARELELLYEYPDCGECDGSGLGADDEDEECSACDGTGTEENEAAAEMRYETPEEVGFKADPIPGYNRGRTRLLPSEAVER